MNWSPTWISSKKPTKQRKYVKNAPLHVRSALLGSHLSKELAKKLNTRSLRVRKGDKVTVMRGQHKGKSGTVDSVDVQKARIYITGVEVSKRDGSKSMYPIHPSKLMIKEIATDKRRLGETAKQTSESKK
jgi:large subunit ribosomal protein L24